MNTVIMQVVPFTSGGDQGRVAYEYTETLVTPGNGNAIIIPDKVQNVNVTVSFEDGGAGIVQATTDGLYNVTTKASGSIIFVDWPNGQVNTTTQEFLKPPTAIMAVQTIEGKMNITVRAQ